MFSFFGHVKSEMLMEHLGRAVQQDVGDVGLELRREKRARYRDMEVLCKFLVFRISY